MADSFVNKVNVWLKLSLLSKTVPSYLYTVTLSTFTPSLKICVMTVASFSKISQYLLGFLYIQVKGNIHAPVAEPINFS